jgi:SCY1-like protein 1
MFAKLSALVGGGSAFPYKLGEQYPTAWGVWSHHAAVRTEDNSSVSVFRASATDLNDPKLVLARNGVKRLRTVRHVAGCVLHTAPDTVLLCMQLRHPNVLTYKDSAEVQEQGSHVVYLVTEPVKPLNVVLDELDLEQQNKYACMHCICTHPMPHQHR